MKFKKSKGSKGKAKLKSKPIRKVQTLRASYDLQK